MQAKLRVTLDASTFLATLAEVVEQVVHIPKPLTQLGRIHVDDAVAAGTGELLDIPTSRIDYRVTRGVYWRQVGLAKYIITGTSRA